MRVSKKIIALHVAAWIGLTLCQSVLAGNTPGTPAGLDPFTLDLYETVDNSPTGTPSEIGPVITLQEDVVPGFVVLLEQPESVAGRDVENWSDLLFFTSRTVQLFSDPSFEGRYDLDDVLANNNAFIQETAPPTIYDVGNVYRIWSDAPESAPDGGATALLLGMGLLAIGRVRRMFN
jgi:hypothetical protein